MNIELEISGDVIERQELLNGTQIVTLEGRSADGVWLMSGIVSWNVGLVEYAGEGDITLTRESDGAELFGTLVSAESHGDDAEGEMHLAVAYAIDGGAGAFEEAAGPATARVTLAWETFSGSWNLDLT
ncbi:MAG TPA: hypothetical protein VIH21_06495 [Dehalococcoidia bacterium]